ncbi:MAG: zf-HC2 domain-containing protein [Cytophagaceae bacterium]|nr:zf-HC2 domain-containing protein [Gemmatimonadaceae bacterium]
MTPLNRLTCEETFRQLDSWLDHELPVAEQHLVDEHLALCAACAREFRFEASLMQSVRSRLREVTLPPALQARVGDLLAVELSRSQEPG